MKKAEPDSIEPGDFIFFATEMLPEELFVISIVVGVVYGFVWLLREIFRVCFGE